MMFGDTMTLWQRFLWACTNEGGYITAIGAGVAALGSVAGGLLSKKSASKAAKLSPQEKRAYDQQAQQLEAAKRWQEMMQPYILKEMGLEPVYDAGGNVVSVRQIDVKTEGERQRERLTAEAGARAERALKGELPMDPATERDIRLGRIRLKDQVRRTFGPAGDLSLGGRAALASQAESEAVMRSRFNREQLGQLEGVFNRGLGDPQSERLRLASAMSGFPRNIMDFAQVMPEGPGAYGAAARYGDRQDALAYAHLGNIFGQAGQNLFESFGNAYNRQQRQPPPSYEYRNVIPSGGGENQYWG